MIPDPFNPFGVLGGAAERLLADGWTRMMLSVWNSGVWLLKVILQMENYFLTPDISGDGPAQPVYQVTLWIGVTLMVIMLMIQLGTSAVRRDGKSIGRVLIGAAQYVIVWFGWVAYGVAILAACAALNKAFLLTIFRVDNLAAWDPWAPFTGQDLTDAVIATVMGLLGLLVWLAGIAHLLVMLTRAGALIVLAVTTPISAAGLVSEVGRGWFWKSFRWFHAAAFAPVLMTLMMGMGIQLASGAALGLSDSTQASIATALPAVVMILTSAVSPLALFKLLAFTDPGTSSGAAVRAGMGAIGGLGGLLQGGGEGGSGAASQADGNGRSSGEDQAETANSSRMMTAAGTAAGLLGPAGVAVGGALKAFGAIGGAAAAISTDISNQMGVGHNTYQPDSVNPGRHRPGGRPSAGQADTGSQDDRSGPIGTSTQDSYSADAQDTRIVSDASFDADDPAQPPFSDTTPSAPTVPMPRGGGGMPPAPGAGGAAGGSAAQSAAAAAV